MARDNIILPFEAISLPGSITVPIGFEALCSASEVIGDPVVFSLTLDKTVERITSNVYTQLVVGIINEKPTVTTCIVIVMGILDGIATGLSRGEAVWVSTSGGLTTTRPVTGHLQGLGIAISPTGIIVNIEQNKVILS